LRAPHEPYGALGALAATLILLAPDVRRGKVKLLDGAIVVFFAAMAIAGVIASPHDGEWLDRWANTISSGVLDVLVLATLPFRPFTADYGASRRRPRCGTRPCFGAPTR
jgi:hypothetical protein